MLHTHPREESCCEINEKKQGFPIHWAKQERFLTIPWQWARQFPPLPFSFFEAIPMAQGIAAVKHPHRLLPLPGRNRSGHILHNHLTAQTFGWCISRCNSLHPIAVHTASLSQKHCAEVSEIYGLVSPRQSGILPWATTERISTL